MSIKLKYIGVKKGRSFILNPNDQLMLGNYIQKFEDGKEIEMTVEPRRIRRTSGQPDELTNFNGYYHAVIKRLIADEMGELDDDYTHNLIQLMVGNFRVAKDGTKVPAGTKNMSGGEFAEFCAKCRIWASKELHLSIPEPHEAEYGQ